MLKCLYTLHNMWHQVAMVNLEELNYHSKIGKPVYDLMEELEGICKERILSHPDSVEDWNVYREESISIIKGKISSLRESISNMKDNHTALEILDELSNGIEEEISALSE